MKKYAIIAGGGSGSRMGNSTPKQFLLLAGKPVLYHTIFAFLQAYKDIELILVLPAAWMEEGEKTMEAFGKTAHHICPGGSTRFHSVQQGLQYVREDSIVFVHDAVRCLLSPALVRHCYEAALQKGSAIPVVNCKDSVRITDAQGAGHQVVDRHRVKLVQTPQTFKSEIILPAYQTAYREAFTDEASVVEHMGVPVSLVEGEDNNIKITTPMDLQVAAQWLSAHG